ncbi:MAG: RNA repair domain-containing protein [Candidatus Hydrothermarchaeales archaeon]
MAKKILKELEWHPGKSLKGVEITYLHRGAPGDCITISTESISRLEKSFFVLERAGREVMIPYHRILELTKGEEVLWKKI